MTPEIAVAIISGIVTIATVIITTRASNKEITHKLETHQAVTYTKIENLTAEVRGQNGLVQSIPVIQEQVRAHDRRIEALERSRRNDD